MKLFPKKPVIFNFNSAKRDYLIIAIALICCILVMSSITAYLIYNNQLANQMNKLNIASSRIERELNKSFDDVSHVMEYFGREISSFENPNINNISQLLQSVSGEDPVAKSLFSWINFDWVDKDNNLFSHTPLLSPRRNFDISYRTYLDNVRRHPWKLFFSELDIGMYSKELVLPAGMGITDDNNEYIGMIAMAFNIRHLTQILHNSIDNPLISFLIVNEDSQLILKSDDIKSDKEGDNVEDILNNINRQIQGKGNIFEKPSRYDNIAFSYYNKIPDTPFTLILGYNQAVWHYELFKIFLLRFVDILCICVLSLILLFWTRKRIVTPIMDLANYATNIRDFYEKPKLNLATFKARELYLLANQLVKTSNYVDKINNKYSELLFEKEELEQEKNEIFECYHETKSINNLIISDILKPLLECKEHLEKLDNKNDNIYEKLMNNIDKSLLFIQENIKYMKYQNYIMDKEIKANNLIAVLNRIVFFYHGESTIKNIIINSNYNKNNNIFIKAQVNEFFRIFDDIISNILQYSKIGSIINIDVEEYKNNADIIISSNGYLLAEIIEEIKDYNNIVKDKIDHKALIKFFSIKHLIEKKYQGNFNISINELNLFKIVINLNIYEQELVK